MNNWKQALFDQLNLLWIEAKEQILGWPVSPLQKHIAVERAKMWQRYGTYKTLWIYVVVTQANWCYLCDGVIYSWQKIQVDHDIPVSRWGYSILKNLHKTHESCNQAKRDMTAAEYKAKKAR